MGKCRQKERVYIYIYICIHEQNSFIFYLKCVNKCLSAEFGRAQVLSLRISLITEG